MNTETWLPQAIMATTAVAWFVLYEPSMTFNLSVTLLVFILSTKPFLHRHLQDITSFGVPTTLVLLLLAPFLAECSPFQGRYVVASIPLFICAVLFCTVEVARGANALDRLADRRALGYIHTDASVKRASTVDRDVEDMTDVESWMSGDTLNELPRIPRRDLESVALNTSHAEQGSPSPSPSPYKWNHIGSSDSLQLSNESLSPRGSVADFAGKIDGCIADGTNAYTLPRDRGPYNGYRARHNTPQMDPDEWKSEVC